MHYANGDILLKVGSRIVLYNSKASRLQDLMINDDSGCYDMVTYIESLVSP